MGSAEDHPLGRLAGYPDEPIVRMRMVRDGKTVVVVELSPAGEGGWLVSGATGCAGFE
jgi:hypothetical protein